MSIIGRRRYPRREFSKCVGVLLNGKYKLFKTREIGEGGIGIETDINPKEGSVLLLTFYLDYSTPVIIKAEVLYGLPLKKEGRPNDFFVGMRYQDLEFEVRRKIREYISSWGDEYLLSPNQKLSSLIFKG